MVVRDTMSPDDLAAVVEGRAPLGVARLILEVDRVWNHFNLPPQLHTSRMTMSLGDGHYADEHRDLAKIDLDYIKGVLEKDGLRVLAAANLLTKGDIDAARRIAAEIKLTEEDLLAAGGGGFGLLLLVVVIVLTLPGDSPQPTAKDKAQSFQIEEESAELMDGLMKDE